MSRYMRPGGRLVILILALFWCAGHARAAAVTDISVRGNAKVESDAILQTITTRPGMELDPIKIRADIKALYDLGFFSDVRVFRDDAAGGVRLIYEVKEKPSIMDIRFSGLEALSEDDFKDKLETKLYTIVNESTITSDLRVIERAYAEKGYYLARASYTLDRSGAGDHEVTLTYHVDEGGKVQVGDIHIIGNKYLTDAAIIDKFMSKPKTRGSAFSTPGSVYHDELVKRDLEVLSYLYKDQGFAEVKVAEPVSLMDPDREFVRLTFEVEEGIQYRVGSITISGDLLYTDEELKEAMQLKPGELFRFSQFRADIDMLVDKYGDKGYAFVDVNPLHSFDREKKEVHLNYEITRGEKVYFGTFTVVGNTKTRDNVIRRELEVADSELYSGTRLTQSKRNIERLGFFEEVQAIRQRDPDNAQVLNYKIRVKEKPTGQLQAAVGFSPSVSGDQESSWFGQGRYSEENQSGHGWKTSLSGRWNGGNNYSLEAGFTDPRVNDSQWSLGFTGFLKNEVRYIAEGVSVQERRVGGSTTVGRRIIELIRGSISYRLTKITQDSEAFLLERFKEEGIASSVIFALSRDATNNYLDPSEGSTVRLSQEFTGGPLLGGDRQYMETTLEGAYYLPLDFTDTYRTYFRFGGKFGLIAPFGGEPIPFFNRYRLGGPEDLRGFEFNSVGPRFNILQAPGDRAFSVVKGGNKQLLFQAEYFFPIIPDANIKGLFFTDMGRVYDDNETVELKDFKRDFGFGFRWITPIAPFRFEWAYPVLDDGSIGDMEFIFYLGY